MFQFKHMLAPDRILCCQEIISQFVVAVLIVQCYLLILQ